MAIQERLLDIDVLWDMAHQPEYDHVRLFMIDGELYEMTRPGGVHGELATIVAAYLYMFVQDRDLGKVTVETGYHPPGDRQTLLGPDIAFLRKDRAPVPFPEKFIPLMPDLAIEIASPTESLLQVRRKARIYLDNGTSLVWIVLPAEKGVDVCRAAAGSRLDIEFVGADGKLSGEEILPGFELDLARLFPPVTES